MRSTRLCSYCVLSFLFAYSTEGYGQPRKVDVLGGPLAGPVMVNVPFSADAVMVVKMAFPSGERLEKTNTAKYYRDSAGRSRIEHVSSAATQSTSARGVPTLIDVDPNDRGGILYVLDAETQTFHSDTRVLLGLGLGAYGDFFAVALGGRRFVTFDHVDRIQRFHRLAEESVQRESLGTRRIEGVEVVGTRTTLTVPAYILRAERGNTSLVTIVDEQWAAPELGILVSARHTDSRFGTIDYRVANVRRAEAPPTLFAVPSGYSIDNKKWWTYTPPELYRADGKLVQ